MLALALLPAPVALASGTLGPVPIESRRFASFAECKAYLEGRHAELVAAVQGEPADTGTLVASRRSIHTRGVQLTGEEEADYDVELGNLARFVIEDRAVIQSQYSYEKEHYLCTGGLLTGHRMQGYHQPMFEPVEPSADADAPG